VWIFYSPANPNVFLLEDEMQAGFGERFEKNYGKEGIPARHFGMKRVCPQNPKTNIRIER